MVNINSFFSQLASQYAARYNSLAERFAPQLSRDSQSALNTQSSPAPDSSAVETGHKPHGHSDSNRIHSESGKNEQAPAAAKSRRPQDRLELSNPGSTELKKTDHDDERAPRTNNGGSVTYERDFSQLRYGLDLSFNAQALQRTIHQLSAIQSGDSTTVNESFESLSSLNIGLGVNFQVEGVRVTEKAELTSSEGAEKAGRYQRQATGRGLESLLKQASRTNENLPAQNRSSYQLAVNKFALRYSSDAQFSFNHFSRFDSQVTAVGEVNPEELDGLSASAGGLAEFASNDVMDSFLDSVDAYLEDSEENLLEKIDQFFDKAGSELGLSSDAIAQAKEQLTSRVENFFEKVESSISSLKNQVFGRDSTETQPTYQIPTADNQPVLDQKLSIDPNLEFLNAMLDALDTLDKEPIDSSDLLNPDRLTLKEPEEALAQVSG